MSVSTHQNRLSHIFSFFFFLMFACICLTGTVSAEPGPLPDEGTATAGQPDPEPSKPFGSSLELGDEKKTVEPAWEFYVHKADDFHRIVSKRLVSTANWLDSFFQDERSEIEENTSTLRLRLSSFMEDGKGVKGDAQLRLRLVLPELEDKFYILITGEQEDTDDLENDTFKKTAEIDDTRDRNVNLSLRYFIKKARDMNLSLKVGARVNGFSPVAYGGPRFRISRHAGPWLIRFTQEVKWFSGEGWESDSRFDFEKFLAESLFFRARTEGYWYEEEYGYFYEVNFSIYQVLDEDRAMRYAWNNYFETRPSHRLDQILLGITYRQRFWRKWLYFELSPQLAFREEDGRHPSPGITVAVEAFFGGRNW